MALVTNAFSGLSCHALWQELDIRACYQPRTCRGHARRSLRIACSKDGSSKPDLIERFFSGLFGKDSLAAEEPGGMKRLSQEVYEQQGPATTTELAALLNEDQGEVRLFRPLLARTSLERIPLRSVPAPEGCKAARQSRPGGDSSPVHGRVSIGFQHVTVGTACRAISRPNDRFFSSSSHVEEATLRFALGPIACLLMIMILPCEVVVIFNTSPHVPAQ